jgi:Tfp pilus assembly protein PilN
MRAVNLLPRDDGRSRSRKAPNPVVLTAAIGGTLVVVGLFLGVTMTGGTLASKRAELQGLESELALIPPPAPGLSAAQVGFADQRSQRAGALASALSRRISWDRVLRRFSLVLPDDVWLTSLNLTSPTPATAPAGAAAPKPGAPPTGFTMVGRTYSYDAVARFLSRLAVVPDLTNVQLQRSSRLEQGGREIVEFAIAADVRSGSVPS